MYWATDAIGESLLIPVTVAFGAGAVALTLYWFFFRIRPLTEEQERLSVN